MQRFDGVLESEDVYVHREGPVKLNLNAFAERFVQTLQQEALDHFVVLGEKHLNHIVSEYVAHYHEERPHRYLLPISDGRSCPVITPPPTP